MPYTRRKDCSICDKHAIRKLSNHLVNLHKLNTHLTIHSECFCGTLDGVWKKRLMANFAKTVKRRYKTRLLENEYCSSLLEKQNVERKHLKAQPETLDDHKEIMNTLFTEKD